ncbi:MAG TPA: nuclear transport factor 2 family protein [Candidatus Thermoplasmatota archaeon]|nr:nuclear transport factor 2 family protein [Candidatus Thermoplasmatota archaeon]
MHPNEALVQRFYEAFGRRDGDAMAACYTSDARFSDPVFPDLRGERIGAMWRMLCLGAKDLEVTASRIRADDHKGSAHWEATYTFSRSGRRVHNVIEASFVFRDGLIERHSDDFDFKAWAAQALGWMGRVFGGSHQLRAKVRKDAAARLGRFAGPGGALPPT